MLWHAWCSVCEGQVYTTALVIYLSLLRPLIPNSTLPVLTSPHMPLVLTYLSPLPASFTPCAMLHTFTYVVVVIEWCCWLQVRLYFLLLFCFCSQPLSKLNFALFRRKTIYIKQKIRVLVKRDFFLQCRWLWYNHWVWVMASMSPLFTPPEPHAPSYGGGRGQVTGGQKPVASE